MSISPEQYTILFTYLVSTIGCYFAFDIAYRLRKSSLKDYPNLLKKNALVVGVGIFATHISYQLAFGNAPNLKQHPIDMIGALMCSYLLALSILNTVQQKGLPARELFYGALVAGSCGYLMSYFYHIASHVGEIQIHLPTALFSFLVTSMTAALAIIAIYWLKDYDKNSLQKLKLLFSVEIALGFLASHIAIDLSLFNALQGEVVQANQHAPNYFSLLLTLTPIIIFLTTFILVIFYDRAADGDEEALNFRNTISGSKRLLAHDPLTHLPNRDALNHYLALSAKRCDRSGESLALAYIDLDHFKPVNDNFGHHIGDLLLIEVSNRLSQAIRNCDYIARAGGDEFIAVLGEISDHQSAVTVVQRIVDTLRQPFNIDEHLIEISCSVGIAMYLKDGDLDKIKVNADAAMYKAKENGKNQYRFYDMEIEQASDAMQQTRIELKDALKNNAFKLLYQPKVDAATQMAHGAEALLRWEHPTRGLVAPAEFIEAAERFGMIESINEWVVSQACQTIQKAKQQGIDLSISVNLSNQQFRNKLLGKHIQAILQEYDVEPRNLILEIAETNAIHHQGQFKETLRQFKKVGLKVSLDDFGLHPFSLSYLQSLDINEVKLDRSLTADVAKKPANLAIVEAIVKLSHALNLNVVAEGVEDEGQRLALLTSGCDQMQGYLFSRPVPQQDLFDVFSELQTKSSTAQFILKSIRK